MTIYKDGVGGDHQAATLIVAAHDSLHPERADYVCDGIDDQVQIQAAIDALPSGGGKVLLMEGTFVFSSQFTVQNNNVKFEGQGDSTILDFIGVAGGTQCIRVYGEITATNSTLTVDPSAGDLTITVTNGGLFTADGWVRIRSEALFNGGTQHYGEIRQIESIAGNVLTLKESLSFAYAQADTATTDLITMREGIHFSNFKMVTTNGNHNYGISIEQVSNVCIENVNIDDFDDRALTITDVCTFYMTGCNIRRCNRAGLGYGLAVNNSNRDIIADDNTFYDCRHAFTCGGDATYGVQTNQIYGNNTSLYNSLNAGMFGLHNSYDGMVVSNNVVGNDGLGYVAGLNTTITGNNIDAMGSQGIRIITGAKYVSVDGNTIKSTNQPGIELKGDASYVNISNNVVDVNGGHGIYDQYSSSNLNIVGNVINSNQGCIYLRHNGATSKTTDMNIVGNHLITTGTYAAIRIQSYSHNAENINIVGNHIRSDQNNYAILVWSNASGGVLNNVNITNNWCKANTCGISTSEVNHFNISSNMISNATTGIYVRNNATGCSDYMVSDNHLINCTTPINDEEGTGTVFKQYFDLLMDVLAVSTTHVRSNEDLSAATPITFTIDAQPDVPRTLSWSFDSHAQITEYDMEVIGVDAKGNTITETWDETDGWSGETNNAFATITTIKMTSRTGTGAADTMDIGITDVLGVSNVIYDAGDVFKIKKNNANVTVAAAQVNTTYDTYDMSVIGLAATDDFTIWYKSNLNIIG